jgi:ferredoxin
MFTNLFPYTLTSVVVPYIVSILTIYGGFMTYVITESWIRCKYTDCVYVCPVDCFYEGESMLVIHPEECIDCDVCEAECRVDAIKPDTEAGHDGRLSLNAKYAQMWAVIHKVEPLPDHEEWAKVPTSFQNSRNIPGNKHTFNQEEASCH